MTRRERVRYEMLLRVRDFGRSETALLSGALTGQQALASVASAIAEIEGYALAKSLSAEAYRDKTALRRRIVDAMREIARTSRGVVIDGGVRVRLRMPRSLSDAAMLRAARAFLDQVETEREQFINLGLSAERVVQLRGALDAFDQITVDPRLGRTGAATAQAGITAAIARGSEAARTLDLVVRNVGGNRPALIAGWERSLRIVEQIRRRKVK